MFEYIDKEWKLFFKKIVKPPSELPGWMLLYGCSVKTDNYTFLKMKKVKVQHIWVLQKYLQFT